MNKIQGAFKPTQGNKGELAPDAMSLTPSPLSSDDYVLGWRFCTSVRPHDKLFVA